jgi:phthalate 4,5-dioxygenase oxygenase subunit
VGAQDKAITESQRPIVDRSRERLGRADTGIIRIRKCLTDAAVALRDQGTPPPGMDPASFRIRPASVLLPKDTPWVESAREQLVAVVHRASPPA